MEEETLYVRLLRWIRGKRNQGLPADLPTTAAVPDNSRFPLNTTTRAMKLNPYHPNLERRGMPPVIGRAKHSLPPLFHRPVIVAGLPSGRVDGSIPIAAPTNRNTGITGAGLPNVGARNTGITGIGLPSKIATTQNVSNAT